MDELMSKVEELVEPLDREVEVVAVQRSGPETLRIFIDRPGGVDLALCERVTRGLGALSAEWALEVSSPGLDRPLTKPAHYRRFLGERVRIRTSEPVGGRRSFTGRLEAADDECLSVADESGRHRIPLDSVHRSNLVPQFSEVSP